MAKRRRMGKQAYRMTSRRKVALRKAQLASARKRKGMSKALKSVGIASAVGVGVLGYKISKSPSIQADIKGRDFRFTNSRNALAGRISPEWKEANVINNAVSPASVARQAPPVTEAKANNSTPKPNSSTKKPNVETFSGWRELAGTSETVVPSQGAVVDPHGQAAIEAARDPNKRTIHPLAADMTKERITEGLKKAGVDPAQATWREIRVLAEVQAEFLNRQGAKLTVYKNGRGSKEFNKYYRSLLDIYGLPSAGDLKEAAKKARGG